MKLLLKLCVVVAFLTCMAYAGEPHTTKQFVRTWVPTHDTTGIGWYHYNLRTMQVNPSNYLTRTSVGSLVQYSASTNSAAWTVEEGNMTDPWLGGDTCITIGGWDIEYDNGPATYGDNVLHTGYYFMFGDTIVGTTSAQTWKADDTLRLIPTPVASLAGGLVDVSINNPKETDHVPFGANLPYDLGGYYVVSDTTGTGSPNSFNVPIGYFPVNGGYGDITICTYDPVVAWGGIGGTHDVLHAIFLVGRPLAYHFKTPYSSPNSNLLTIVGIQEDEKTPTSCAVFTAPVFRHSTAIRYTLPNQTHVTLKIYNTSGQLIQTLVDGVKLAGEHTVNFDASKLSSGIYFYHFETTEETLSGKLIALR